MTDNITVGEDLRNRRTKLLNIRSEEERRKIERITKPFNLGGAMISKIMIFKNNMGQDEDLIISARLEVGSFDINREFEKEIQTLAARGMITSLDHEPVTDFINEIFENFKNSGGGKVLSDFCTKEQLGVEFALSDANIINCYVTWL